MNLMQHLAHWASSPIT